jgi:hypothetical protein
LDKELQRLVKREGFVVAVVGGEPAVEFSVKDFRSAAQIKEASKKCPRQEWAGFQLYYPMPEREVRAASGYELTKAICGVFDEVVPAMNCVMQVALTANSRE